MIINNRQNLRPEIQSIKFDSVDWLKIFTFSIAAFISSTALGAGILKSSGHDQYDIRASAKMAAVGATLIGFLLSDLVAYLCKYHPEGFLNILRKENYACTLILRLGILSLSATLGSVIGNARGFNAGMSTAEHVAAATTGGALIFSVCGIIDQFAKRVVDNDEDMIRFLII